MIIQKMTASFGKLRGDTLTLKEGLNVVEAPNESGKSTWCAFILAMLYGVDSSQRARAGYMPDKTRYAPWSGAPMEGEMDILSGGRELTLRRSTRQAASPMREFSAVYAGTGESVPGLTGSDAGETLTGVSREVLRRSAFIGQGDMAVTGAAELEKRIATVVSSGEEGLSYTEADERLRAWQRKRRFNRRGAIPEIEAEILERRELISRLGRSVTELESLSEELEACRREKTEAAGETALSRERSRRDLSARLEACRDRELDCERVHSAAVERSARLKAELAGDVFGATPPEDGAEAAELDAAEAQELLERSQTAVVYWPIFVFLFLALGAVVAGIVFSWYFYLGAGVLVLTAGWIFTDCGLKKKAAAQALAKRRTLLAKYGAEDEAGIYAAADAHADLWQRSGDAVKSVDKAASELRRVREEQKSVEARLLSGEDSEETRRLAERCAQLEARALSLQARRSELSGAMGALGDPMVAASALREAEARKAELEEQYDAIGLAVDTLREADAEIRGRFSPLLGMTAAGYLSRLTGGRYDQLTLSRDFSAMARITGDSVSRDSAYMSAGALDMMYLAVRLAVCQLALPAEDPCPLVLDDALVEMDPERQRLAMEVLGEIAKTRQVILFKCR